MKRIGCMKKTNNRGFSLVEVIVVCLIIAVLAAIAAPSLIRYIDNNKEKECRINRKGLLDLLDSARIMKPEVSMTELIAREKDEIICPSGGTYSENAYGGAKCSIHGGDDEILMVKETETPVETISPPPVVEPTAAPTMEAPTPTPEEPTLTPIPTQTPLPDDEDVEKKEEIMEEDLENAASSWKKYVDECIEKWKKVSGNGSESYTLPPNTIYYNAVDRTFVINLGKSDFKVDKEMANSSTDSKYIIDPNNYTGSDLLIFTLAEVHIVSGEPIENPGSSPYICYCEEKFYIYYNGKWITLTTA